MNTEILGGNAARQWHCS